MQVELKNKILIVIGWIFFSLGVIGALLPIIPTVPFMIVAAACFSKGSPKIHAWMLRQQHIGPAIYDWEKNRVIRLRSKITASFLITGGLSISLATVPLALSLKIIIAAIGLIAIVFIWLQKSTPKKLG